MRTTFTVFALVVSALMLVNCVYANDVKLSPVSLVGQDTVANTTFVTFNLSWENSWRDIVNWDACWVFVKFSTDNGETWRHATLDTLNHVVPGGSFEAASDRKGVFIYRSSNGFGSVAFNSVRLKWLYGLDAVPDDFPVKVKVFAVELVHIRKGEFAAGDGGTTNGRFRLTTINTDNATQAPSGTGSLGGQAGGYPTSQTAPTKAAWPNGYRAFYCMKYEMTEQQYVDFLNTLTAFQASNRVNNPLPTAGRYGISGIHPNYISSKPNNACGYLIWPDACAYADWAALRPMTELEFEKACRGANQQPLQYEFAWGTTSADSATTIVNEGLANEMAGNAGANANYGSYLKGYGPMRVGCFATSSSTRESAGASYYGIMELSGNLYEMVASLASSYYEGTNGDGILNYNGNAVSADWPERSYNTGEVVGTNVALRGGSCSGQSSQMQVSDRTWPYNNIVQRGYGVGFRAVRWSTQ